MKTGIKAGYPLGLTLFAYWLLTFALLGAALVKARGHFGYPLDDPYIHMAISRHLVETGSWGVSQSSFSSSTSSPLWVLLIALTYKISGINDWTPFALSLLFGSLALCYCSYLFRKISTPTRSAAWLIVIVLITPLPILTLTGMEHTLHALLTLWLMDCAATYLTTNGASPRPSALLLILAGLITMTRYEGLFLVLSIGLLCLAARRLQAAFWIGGAGFLPVAVYGAFSMAHGWYFLPNSLLLKGNAPVLTLEGIAAFLLRLPVLLIFAPHVLMLTVACLCIFIWIEQRKIPRGKESFLIALFVPMTLLHLQFASIGMFYRYEAYLVFAGSAILAASIGSLAMVQSVKAVAISRPAAAIAVGIFSAAFLSLAWRAGRAMQDYPSAVTNIFEQQYQMGLFLKRYYSGRSVAANDIGEINYLADIRTLDLYGLGSMEVARAKRKGSYDKKVIDELVLSHDVEVVIIYNSWFEGNIPAGWLEVGRWRISNNVICGDDEISFYAPRAATAKELAIHLREFSSLLPITITQSGIYLAP